MAGVTPTIEETRRTRLSSFRAVALKHAVLMVKQRENKLVSADFDAIFTTALELKQRAKELGLSNENIQALLDEATRGVVRET